MNRQNSAQEDSEAVDRVLAGNTDAFAELVRRWQGPLINLAWRFCRDRSRAEEMAQEAFLRAFRSLGQWRREAAFSTWLFSLAANVYRSELKRHPAAMLSLNDIAAPPDPRLSTTLLEDADTAKRLRLAVLALPAKYRDALLLYYFHEEDISEAARTLNIPEGTLKTRLARGRGILKQKFTQARPARKRFGFFEQIAKETKE